MRSTICCLLLLCQPLGQVWAVPTLNLGFCAYNEDVNNPPPWPGVVAVARKAFESVNPIVPLPGTASFEVNWYMAYAETSGDSIKEGINRIFGNRMPGVTHAPAHVVVGCGGSSTSAKVAPIGALLGVPLVSWWAGSPDLSNKLEYPYFMRTRGTSTGNGAGVIRLCKHFQWQRVGFVYELQSFHIGVYEGAVAAAQQLSVEVVPFRLFHFPDQVNQVVWDESMHQVAATSLQVFGMSVMGPVSKNRAALEAARSAGLNSRLFVAALELQDFYPSHPEELRMAFNGMVGIDYSQSGMNDISAKFEQAWNAMDFTQMAALGIPQGYIDSMSTMAPQVFSNSPFMQFQAYLFDAIMSALIAYQRMLDAGLPDNVTTYGQDYLDALYGLSFRGASGDVSFTPIVDGKGGDREISTFVVFNTQNGVVQQIGSLGAALTLDQAVVFPDGGSDPRAYDAKLDCASGQVRVRDAATGAVSCTACAAGEGPDATGEACAPCPVGYMSPTAGSECSPCMAGSHQELPGQSRCSDCLPGTFTNHTGMAKCTACPAGSAAANAASELCEPCREGMEQPEDGQAVCLYCKQGSFNPVQGALQCLKCSGGRTTATQGAVAAEECVCPEGFYSISPSDPCLPCPAGMVCPLGSDLSYFPWAPAAPATILNIPRDFPQLAPGHFSARAEPLDVFRCLSDAACPGGAPGTCGGGRGEDGGFLCATCGVGEYMDQGGACQKCSSGDIAVLIIAFIVGLILVGVLARASAMKVSAQKPHLGVLFMVLGQLATFLQVGATFRMFGILWGSPFERFLEAFSLFSLNLNVLKFGCLSVGSDGGLYAVQLFVPLCFVVFLTLIYGAMRSLRPGQMHSNALINSIGQMATLLYITLALVAFVPFHCYKHPNGSSSVIQFPQTLCSDTGTYPGMLAMGIIGILVYPALTLGTAVYAIWKYPSVMMSADIGFIWRFRFMFFRWTPEAYWFGGVLMLRNFLLAVFPMTLPEDNADVTAMLMQLTLLISLLLTVAYWPWKTSDMNCLDIALNFVLVFVMAVGSMTVFGNPLSDGMSIFLIVVAVFALVFAVLVALYRSILTVVPRAKYALFLSHHKGSGACMARMLKYTLQRELKQPIFYDCDDLTSFGAIFDSVKQSRCLLVVLSGETLRRPWCVGEIVTAHLCKVPMVTLSMGSSGEGSKQWLASFAAEQADFAIQFAELRPFGITPEDILPAITALVSNEPLKLTLGSTQGLVDSVKSIVKEVMVGNQPLLPAQLSLISKRSTDSPRKSQDAKGAGAVLILSDFENHECAASAHLLRWMVQEKVQDTVAVDLDITDEEYPGAVASTSLRAVLCCITASSKTSPTQLARLAVLHSARPQGTIIAVIIGDSFDFPNQQYYAALEDGTADFSTALAARLPEELSSKDVAEAMRSLFKGIAMFINVPFASSSVLSTSVTNLAKRVKDVWVTPGGQQVEGGRVLSLTPRSQAAASAPTPKPNPAAIQREDTDEVDQVEREI